VSAADAAAGRGEMKVVPVLLPCIAAFSTLRVFLPKDLRPKEARDTMWDRLKEASRRFPDGIPLLDPIEDMHVSCFTFIRSFIIRMPSLQIDNPEFAALVERCLELQTRIAAGSIQSAPDRLVRFEAYKKKLAIKAAATELNNKIAACKALVEKEMLKKMKRVLRRLGHVNADNVVQVGTLSLAESLILSASGIADERPCGV
jgi:ATP-dependent RNA helicase DOB1